MKTFLFLIWFASLLHQSVEQFDDGYSESEATKKEIIDVHNDFRRNVQPPASNMLKLSWNSTLAEIAGKWSVKCFLNHSSPSFRKLNEGVCGENIMKSPTPMSWRDIIKVWYDESLDFVYGKGPITSDAVVAHYTQVVWYRTYQLGCAYAYCENSEYQYFYVCSYWPSGNQPQRIYRPYNNGKQCSECTSSCNDGICTNFCPMMDTVTNCDEVEEGHLCGNNQIIQCNATCECGDRIY
ncbi:hypothetical protein FKM82_011335 [Ascaphus truei]